MTHWLLVNSPENFERSRAREFDVAGMKTRWRKAAAEVATDDTIFFYLTGKMAIGGEARVTGPVYEAHDTIWPCSHVDEHYPWRIPTTPTVMRAVNEYLLVKDFIMQYEYARKWPADHWTLAFQGNVHRLGEADYCMIHSLLE